MAASRTSIPGYLALVRRAVHSHEARRALWWMVAALGAVGILLPAMFVVGAIFAAIWGYLLSLRHELVGTPGGWRLLVS